MGWEHVLQICLQESTTTSESEAWQKNLKWNSGIFMLTNLFLWWCVAYKLQNRHFCRQKQRQTLACYHRWQGTVQTAEPPLLSSEATTPLAMYSSSIVPH